MSIVTDSRPDPEKLLARVQAEQTRAHRGKLRLFFGMSAGVGKTCSMLKAAHERLKDGKNVFIGIVETHSRTETRRLTEGLPAVPAKIIAYRGTELSEMDLDAIIEKRPDIVLVDELAHTNAPGSRHEKRYQDVIEILENGIDVYTTMNVQHLESRADIVGLITAITVRETVPDSILDLVDQIDLIDVTPQELLTRLKEGKIYPGRKTDTALQYFFQEGNLNALREIALRVTADKVDRDSRNVTVTEALSGAKTKTGKVLVAVSHSPFSDRLIRTARRLVEDLETTLIAVHVDSGRVLETEDNNQLIKNLELARELGADTITLHNTDFAAALIDFTHKNGVAQIVVGRPGKSKYFWNANQQTIQKLIRQCPDVDITVLHEPASSIKSQPEKPKFDFFTQFHLAPTAKVIGSIFFVSLISHFLHHLLGYRAVGFLYLLNLVILSVSAPYLYVIGATVISTLAWNYNFIPPRGTFAISAPEDIMMCGAFFIISSVTVYLTSQIKKNQKILKDREEKTRALYDILKSMTLVKGFDEIVSLALQEIEKIFSSTCCVITSKNSERFETDRFIGRLSLSDNDLAVAAWCFDNGKMAGWSTDTLPLSPVLCLALKSGERRLGVLVFRPTQDRKLNPDQKNLLISITNQIGMAIAKDYYDAETEQARLLQQSEKLHQTLLNSISHELRTPLTTIMGSATALQKNPEISSVKNLAHEIVSASERLNHVFENLLDMTRLESGVIKPVKEWFELVELAYDSAERHKRLLGDHDVIITDPDNKFYTFADYNLLEHALSNILINSARYSPKHSKIEVTCYHEGPNLCLAVRDYGPGLPENQLENIFDKFYRAPGTTSGGLGLGLSITKNLIELHSGTISAKNHPDGGAIFTIRLPRQEPPAILQEMSK